MCFSTAKRYVINTSGNPYFKKKKKKRNSRIFESAQ